MYWRQKVVLQAKRVFNAYVIVILINFISTLFPVTSLHCINLFEVYNSCINHPSLNFHSVFNGSSTKYLLQIETLQKFVVIIILKKCLKSRNLDVKCNIVQKRISILIDVLNNHRFSRYNT